MKVKAGITKRSAKAKPPYKKRDLVVGIGAPVPDKPKKPTMEKPRKGKKQEPASMVNPKVLKLM